MVNISILYTTIGSPQEAEALAKELISQKMASCVNIIPKALSFYEWDGQIEKSEECLMIFKTTSSNIDSLKTAIVEKHPYTIPAMLSGEVSSSEDFYQFCKKGTS